MRRLVWVGWPMSLAWVRYPQCGSNMAFVGGRPAGSIRHRHSGIAQLAEQLTVNQWVAGSSPAPGARRPTVHAVGLRIFRTVVGVVNGGAGGT